jgi:signal transduction histidine kinase
MHIAARYAVAVAATIVAVLATLAFPDLLSPMRLFFFWVAVLTTAMVSGTGPALFATVLSLASATYFLFAPFESVLMADPRDVIRLTLFALFASGISVAVGMRQRLSEQLRTAEGNAVFINRASELLSSSLAVQETMRSLARLCVPALGDWCAIDLADGPAPSGVGPVGAAPIVQVLQSGRTQLLDEAIIAPMIARGRTLGAVTVVRGDSRRLYTADDVPLIEDLARRAATSLDNARLYEAAEAANRAKDEFLATLSHELRTPLTAISGWAHMLELGIPDADTHRLAVQTIIRSARAQTELIDDLLDLSSVVAGTLHLEVTSVDLVAITLGVLEAAQPAADAKGVAVQGPAQDAVIVRGDERRLRQIVWNLVSNAVKFSDGGGTVRVIVSNTGSAARVEVSDTGRGIDAAFLPHVWDRFRQADGSTSRQYGGLGLGLSIVRHLVEMHGGTVHAESDGAGQGATFRIEIPLQ